ncbi:MAG: hypothetical protein BZY88_09155 [SAR202 cluster bacterium Io17-Chloro-G9]|nr:MAG: hypothetical protein BZY88_09155 [SAR202 cluster bacterium Io17-Chloro-G9]
MNALYLAGKSLGQICFNAFGRLEVIGKDSVPPYGPLLVVANHLSFNDPPVLVCSIPRTLSFIGKKELFGNPIGNFLMRNFNVHPYDRSGLGVDSIRLALRLLDQDRMVMIFPEGHRSPDHTLKEGMPGAAYIALKSQAPVLPIGITGTERISPWRMPVPLTKFRVNIGQPFTLPNVEGTPSKDVLNNMRDMMMSRIAALLPPSYRGVYPLTTPGQAQRASRQAGAASRG